MRPSNRPILISRRPGNGISKNLTFVTVARTMNSDFQYNIIPKSVTFENQKWILTCRENHSKKILKIPMADIKQWNEIINEDINIDIGSVY
jgi:hypothetical protein